MDILYLAYWFSWLIWLYTFIVWLISYMKYNKNKNVRTLNAMTTNIIAVLIMCIIQATIGLVIFFEFR